MFTHQGKARTLSHNLRIASLLSFVAGIVNVAGFLAVQKLTTNVTGHFAFFVDELFKLHFWDGFVYFLYIFFFFLGSFTSSYLVELISQKTERNRYVFPASIEIVILFGIAIFGSDLIAENPNIIACSLLFAMGLQNSLVTKISNATVRTTHLTGLFTDLGIELSQLFFYKEAAQKKQLYSSIKLRLTIISFFFIGGIVGGIFYGKLALKVLCIAAIALVFGLIYDHLKLKILLLNRKLHH
ncbi:YoaK family protein [Flavobacterium phycosphaerae]|uniref:YoaK family protein n=1 Tax=Flavobacterium phycosphaerae TaxID=2697515 RepID=UPI0013896074|nr:YoaK family protein [Flavobacterium phycosphaerae]